MLNASFSSLVLSLRGQALCFSCTCLGVLALTGVARGESMQANDAQALKVRTMGPRVDDNGEHRLRVGEELSLTFVVDGDLSGDARILIDERPAGSHWDGASATFKWSPGPEQHGVHRMTVIVLDGQGQAEETVVFRVRKNEAPTVADRYIVLQEGQATISLRATDPDGDTLRYEVLGLPPGASIDSATGVLHWAFWEDDDDVMPASFTLAVSDGTNTREAIVTLERPRSHRHEEWESYFLPGANFAAFTPRASSELGNLYGATLEVAVAAWIHRNENRGPSHGRIFVYTELLNSTNGATPLTLGYGAGFSLSLERNPRRHWLVPYYGVDLGGLRRDDTDGIFHWTPNVGVHLWSSQNVFVNARVGYRIAPQSLERWSGGFASIGGDFTVW